MSALPVLYMTTINLNRKNVDFDLTNTCSLFLCLYRTPTSYILSQFSSTLKLVDKTSPDKT